MVAHAPDFSIIVPTYRRRDALARCVRAIEQLEFPRERFELLVVDDGSPEPPADIIASVAPDIEVQLVCGRHAGPAAARNTGATLARGRMLVFTDDDCAPQPDWLRAIDRAAAGMARPVAIGGRTVNVLSDDVFAQASQGIVDFLYEYYGGNASPGHFFATNNLAVPRTEFLELGGFDEGFVLAAAEDRDLCERWQAAGWELRYEPAAVVDHAHALGFGGFNRQHFNYGRGAYDLHRSRARRGRDAVRLEPLRFYRGLITHPLRHARGWGAFRLAAIHLWSQVAYASGYFTERIRRGWGVTDRSAGPEAAERPLPDRRAMRTPARTASVQDLFDGA